MAHPGGGSASVFCLAAEDPAVLPRTRVDAEIRIRASSTVTPTITSGADQPSAASYAYDYEYWGGEDTFALGPAYFSPATPWVSTAPGASDVLAIDDADARRDRGGPGPRIRACEPRRGDRLHAVTTAR